ncbi:MAG: PEP-CTERM sorting domain-containing protein [Sedimentisphaerales bacterium]
MKKLLVLMLVLGLASVANAAIQPFSIEVAAGAAPPSETSYVDVTDITLHPSDMLWIGIYNSVQGDRNGAQKGTFFLGIDQPANGGPADTSWTGNSYLYIPPLVTGTPGNTYLGILDWNGDGSLMLDTWQADLSDGRPDTFNGIGVLDAKQLHCDKAGSTDVVQLYDGDGILLDTLTIHQIPEPMTMVLLGLGGLFLRRRK